MDSFELNKIIGAVLATVFVVFSASIASDALFHSPVPEQEGYALVAAEPEAGAGGPAEETGPEPVGPLLASADAAAGEAAFRRCAACHTADEGGANRIGPNLYDVVDHAVAAREGFSYSAAMRAHATEYPTWDYEHLAAFLASPRAVVPGTAMNFPGISGVQDRANMVAYLRSLSASPAPLPDPAAAAPSDGTAGEEAAPADTSGQATTEEDSAGEGAAPADTTEEAAPAAEGGVQPEQGEEPGDDAGQQAPADAAAPQAPAGAPASPANTEPAESGTVPTEAPDQGDGTDDGTPAATPDDLPAEEPADEPEEERRP